MIHSRKLIIVIGVLVASVLGFSVVSAGAGGLVGPVGPQPAAPCTLYAPQPRLLDDPQTQVAFEAGLAQLNAVWFAGETLENCYMLHLTPEEHTPLS